MKSVINLKHWPSILFSVTFLTSFIISKSYTDPFFTPKNLFFFFSSGLFILIICLVNYNKKYQTSISFSLLDLAILGFIIFSAIRILFSPGISLDNIKFYLFFLNGLLYFLIKPYLSYNQKDKKKFQVETIVNILLIMAILQASWGILQYLKIFPNLQAEFKIGGAFGNPGQYTNFITPLLSFSLAVMFFSKKIKTLGIIATVSILVILPLTQARTAWIGAILVIIYLADKKYLILKRLSGILKSSFVKVIVITSTLIVLIFSGYFLYNLKKESSSGRVFVWQVSLQMVKDRPLWGFGFDRFAAAHNDYQASYFKKHPDDIARAEIADGVNYAFNEFIQVTVESGLIGLILLASIFVFALITRKEKTDDEEENIYFFAAKGSVIAILVSMIFSYPLHTVSSMTLLFFSLAVIDAGGKQHIFDFAVQPKFRKKISVLGILIVAVFLIVQFNRNNAERAWVNAFKLMRENRYDEAYNAYQEIYPTLKYSQFFMFNYGAELLLMQRYEESIKILKGNELRLNDSDHYIYLGSSYEGIGKIDSAENCFLKASLIMPLKFFPKYKLVLIYLQTGRKKQAINLAKYLLAMKVKVPSQTIDAIKQEMKQLVDNSVSEVK